MVIFVTNITCTFQQYHFKLYCPSNSLGSLINGKWWNPFKAQEWLQPKVLVEAPTRAWIRSSTIVVSQENASFIKKKLLPSNPTLQINNKQIMFHHGAVKDKSGSKKSFLLLFFFNANQRRRVQQNIIS